MAPYRIPESTTTSASCGLYALALLLVRINPRKSSKNDDAPHTTGPYSIPITAIGIYENDILRSGVTSIESDLTAIAIARSMPAVVRVRRSRSDLAESLNISKKLFIFCLLRIMMHYQGV